MKCDGRYVVIGASGILAPLGQTLQSWGVRAVGISRGSRLSSGSWDERVSLDTENERAVTDWVASQKAPVCALVAYAPAVGPACWSSLAAVARQRVVVATTQWIDVPATDTPWYGLSPLVVQLGWARTDHGTRWHTPQEVSAAVAHALAIPAPSSGVVLVGESAP